MDLNIKAYIRIITAVFAAFAAGFLSALSEAYLLSGAVIISAAIIIFFCILKLSKKALEPLAFFLLSWMGGVGVSALKLSYLQTDWNNTSWVCFFLAALFFIIGHAAVQLFFKNTHGSLPESKEIPKDINQSQEALIITKAESNGLFAAINIVVLLSILSLIIEACILGYVPLFTIDTPHAYSYFHVRGIHYFTVSCVLVPSLEVVWFSLYNKNCGSFFKRAELLTCLFISVFIPLLLVSRFQLIFAVVLSVITFFSLNGGRLPFKLSKKRMAYTGAMLCFLIAAYVFLSIERAHSIEYLNGIFEMKNASMPIFLSQPYIYIANNFDNFNCLVNSITEHTGGLRMLFPVFALTGMKFTHPELTAFPLYVTKEELTTVTLIYDAYYDFGIAGVSIFCFVLGAFAAFTEAVLKGSRYRSITAVLIYAQLLFYLLFSFFTTWFSNPAVWFYFTATAAIGIFVRLFCIFYRHADGKQAFDVAE